MAEPNEEAAVNAMAAQAVYGDDDLKRDMEEFVVAAVVKALHSMDTRLISAVASSTWQPMANQIIVNRAREIEKIVARYLTMKLSGDQY